MSDLPIMSFYTFGVFVALPGHLTASSGHLQRVPVTQRLGLHLVVQHANHRAQGW